MKPWFSISQRILLSNRYYLRDAVSRKDNIERDIWHEYRKKDADYWTNIRIYIVEKKFNEIHVSCSSPPIL